MTTTFDNDKVDLNIIPLIKLPDDVDEDDDISRTSQQKPQQQQQQNNNDTSSSSSNTEYQISKQIIHALQSSGFLLIQSNKVSYTLQQQVLEYTRDVLLSSQSKSATYTSTSASKTSTSTSTSSSSSSLQDENSAENNDTSITRSSTTNPDTTFPVIKHPKDPKLYIMLDSKQSINNLPRLPSNNHDNIDFDDDDNDNDSEKCSSTNILEKYWNVMEDIKRQLLKYVAIGLDLKPYDYLLQLHEQNNNALRLLHYYDSNNNENKNSNISTKEQSIPSQQETNIRCKAHSDYGTLTLLLTDDTPGLQALIDNRWINVPYIPGALVVNIGSLLSDWTDGKLLATIHRVVTISNNMRNSYTTNVSNDEEVNVHDGTITSSISSSSTPSPPRTSLAFFVDPDEHVSTILKQPQKTRISDNDDTTTTTTASNDGKNMTVAEYIQWRSGIGQQTSNSSCDTTTNGMNDPNRSGVAYTYNEEVRANQVKEEG